MTVFQFGVRVAAPPREGAWSAQRTGDRPVPEGLAGSAPREGARWGQRGRARWVEAVARGPSAREPLVLAPLVQGRCHDAVVEGGPVPHRALVHFDREAASFAAAVVTAVVDLEHSGLACLAVVPDDNLVTVGVIAPRVGTTPRRLGGLLRDGPSPVYRCGGEQVFRWSDVVAWLDAAPGSGPTASVGAMSATAPEPVLAALNLALRLRGLVRGDADLAAAVRDLLAAR